MREHFVPLAADADAADPEVMKLAAQIPNAAMLPLVMLTDTSGAYLGGHSGILPQPKLLELIEAVL